MKQVKSVKNKLNVCMFTSCMCVPLDRESYDEWPASVPGNALGTPEPNDSLEDTFSRNQLSIFCLMKCMNNRNTKFSE